MEKEYKNKAIKTDEVKQKSQTTPFFFPGGLEYEPMTIQAIDNVEAEKLWEKKRTKVNS